MMTENELKQRYEGRTEGQNRMATLLMRMIEEGDIDAISAVANDVKGMKLARAYERYLIPDFGRTELDLLLADAREKEQKEQEEIYKELFDDDDEEPQQDEELKPICFEIDDPDDLMKVREFERRHYKTCRFRFPDFTGAMFEYTAIPTGLGTLYTVKCPCGESVSLSGAMA